MSDVDMVEHMGHNDYTEEKAEDPGPGDWVFRVDMEYVITVPKSATPGITMAKAVAADIARGVLPKVSASVVLIHLDVNCPPPLGGQR